MRENELKSIGSDMLNDILSLKVFNLSGNQIKSIDCSIFKHLNVTSIYLKQNSIDELNSCQRNDNKLNISMIC